MLLLPLLGTRASYLDVSGADTAAYQESGAAKRDNAGTTPVQAIALFAYTAADEEEVSFEQGDEFVDVEDVEEGWSKGTVLRTGGAGTFPSNYVQFEENAAALAAEEDRVAAAKLEEDGRKAAAAAAAAAKLEEDTRKAAAAAVVLVQAAEDAKRAAPELEASRTADVPDAGTLTAEAVALFAYTASDADEVSFKKGDEFVNVEDAEEDGWLKGTVVRTGSRGSLPTNYVSMQKAEAVQESAASPRMEALLDAADAAGADGYLEVADVVDATEGIPAVGIAL